MPGRPVSADEGPPAGFRSLGDSMSEPDYAPENVGILAAEVYFPNTFVSLTQLVGHLKRLHSSTDAPNPPNLTIALCYGRCAKKTLKHTMEFLLGNTPQGSARYDFCSLIFIQAAFLVSRRHSPLQSPVRSHLYFISLTLICSKGLPSVVIARTPYPWR